MSKLSKCVSGFAFFVAFVWISIQLFSSGDVVSEPYLPTSAVEKLPYSDTAQPFSLPIIVVENTTREAVEAVSSRGEVGEVRRISLTVRDALSAEPIPYGSVLPVDQHLKSVMSCTEELVQDDTLFPGSIKVPARDEFGQAGQLQFAAAGYVADILEISPDILALEVRLVPATEYRVVIPDQIAQLDFRHGFIEIQASDSRGAFVHSIEKLYFTGHPERCLSFRGKATSFVAANLSGLLVSGADAEYWSVRRPGIGPGTSPVLLELRELRAHSAEIDLTNRTVNEVDVSHIDAMHVETGISARFEIVRAAGTGGDRTIPPGGHMRYRSKSVLEGLYEYCLFPVCQAGSFRVDRLQDDIAIAIDDAIALRLHARVDELSIYPTGYTLAIAQRDRRNSRVMVPRNDGEIWRSTLAPGKYTATIRQEGRHVANASFDVQAGPVDMDLVLQFLAADRTARVQFEFRSGEEVQKFGILDVLTLEARTRTGELISTELSTNKIRRRTGRATSRNSPEKPRAKNSSATILTVELTRSALAAGVEVSFPRGKFSHAGSVVIDLLSADQVIVFQVGGE